MKILALIALALLLAVPGMAMTNNQTSYLAGLDDGWSLCYLRLTNLTAYNAEVDKYNAELLVGLNETEAAAHMLAYAEPVAYELPEVFR